MELAEVLTYFQGVKGHGDKYMAICPCHGDKKQSLSIGRGQTGVLIKCMAGCDTRDVIARAGLRPRDLFFREPVPRPAEPPQVTAVYQYPQGVQKLRRADKTFLWRRPDGHGGWIYNRQGTFQNLYAPKGLGQVVLVAEGEKDVDTLLGLGYPSAACGADGAGRGKWRREYTDQLQGKHVYVFMDNDTVGRDFARETAQALYGRAAGVYLMDLQQVWPEMPEHGDVSDLVAAVGAVAACEKITALLDQKPWTPEDSQPDPIMQLVKPLGTFQERQAQWLVPGWIPQGQITLLAADGGVGKTSLWCHILAAVSAGRRCILDPEGWQRPAQRVMFLTTEDSVQMKLHRKLRLAGGDMDNILVPDLTRDFQGQLEGMRFGTEALGRIIRAFRPALCVIDPIQAFVPQEVNMGSRNAMRGCLGPLLTLGEETGTTFLVVCHTNKRTGSNARGRVSDSADMWDIARSVLMAGYTEEEGVRYLSNEKNNYDALQDTVLFSLDEEGLPQIEGTSWKRDRDYNQESAQARSAPKREDCKTWVLAQLTAHGGTMPSRDLEESAKSEGFSRVTLQRVKTQLKKSGQIKFVSVGSNDEKSWLIQIGDEDAKKRAC